MNNISFLERIDCEVCGSPQNSILISKSFTDATVWDFLESYYERRITKEELRGGVYEIKKCSRCEFLWQGRVLAPILMEKLYNKWISSEQSLNKKRFADVSLFAGYARDVERISYLIKKRPSEIDVLDFGMGWGYWCFMAKAFNYNVCGLELSKDRISYALEKNIEVIDDLSPLAGRRFDFINSEQVFEHICEPLTILKGLVSILQPGGIIRIAVPNGVGMREKLSKPNWRASKDPLHPLEHINCFTYDTLVRLGDLAGLKVIDLSKHPSGGRDVKARMKQFTKGILGCQHINRGTDLCFRKRQ